MLMLLSPAKSLTTGPAVDGYDATQPALMSDVELLMQTTRKLDAADLKSLMHISDDLADLNRTRFQEFETPFTRDNAKQAALLFDGDVYKGLDAPSLSPDDLAWANDHLAILSGLYGVLRPLDLMQPYRLEMGTKLANPRGKDLYAFWKERIAPVLAERAAGQPIVNLASNEYFSAVDQRALGVPVITPSFRDVKDGKARVLAFFAKRARGAMVRWAIEHRVTDPEQLKDCDAMGYRFVPEASCATKWEFRRPQPPPVR